MPRYTADQKRQAARLLLLGGGIRAVSRETGMSTGLIQSINRKLQDEGAKAFGLETGAVKAEAAPAPAPAGQPAQPKRKRRRQRSNRGAIRKGGIPATSSAPEPDGGTEFDVPDPPMGVVIGPGAPSCDTCTECKGVCPAAMWGVWARRFAHFRALIGTTDATAVRDAGGVLVDPTGAGAKGVALVGQWLDAGRADVDAQRYDTPAARFLIEHRAAAAKSSGNLTRAIDGAAQAGQGSALASLNQLRASIDPDQFGRDGRPVFVGGTSEGDDVGADILGQLRREKAAQDAADEAAG